jgi:gamma-tubulin complex component 2
MSINDRRASHMNAPRPRVASGRVVGDAEKLGLRGGTASPLQAENMDHRGSTSTQKSKVPRDHITSEKRTERLTVQTKEKVHGRSRNPVRESPSAGNRGEGDKSRSRRANPPEALSPSVKKKEKEASDR